MDQRTPLVDKNNMKGNLENLLIADFPNKNLYILSSSKTNLQTSNVYEIHLINNSLKINISCKML